MHLIYNCQTINKTIFILIFCVIITNRCDSKLRENKSDRSILKVREFSSKKSLHVWKVVKSSTYLLKEINIFKWQKFYTFFPLHCWLSNGISHTKNECMYEWKKLWTLQNLEVNKWLAIVWVTMIFARQKYACNNQKWVCLFKNVIVN